MHSNDYRFTAIFGPVLVVRCGSHCGSVDLQTVSVGVGAEVDLNF